MADLQTLENYCDRIRKDSNLSETNRKLLINYKNRCLTDNLGVKRVYKYLITLRRILYVINKDLDKVTREDIEGIVLWVRKNDEFSEWTKHDYLVTIKKYYRVTEGDDFGDYPKKVKGIKSNIKPQDEFKNKEVLTAEDLDKMVISETNIMYKALYRFLFESGPRYSEFIALRRRDIDFNSTGMATVRLRKGKTGERQIVIYNCVPSLKLWFDNMKNKEPDAFVWSNGKSNHICYATLSERIKITANRCDINKPKNIHTFRASSASYNAQFFTESELCQYYGWIQGSDVVRYYVRLSARAMENAVKRKFGLAEGEKTAQRGKVCICGFVNDPGFEKCMGCGRSLNLKGDTQEKLSKALAVYESLIYLAKKYPELDGLLNKITDNELNG